MVLSLVMLKEDQMSNNKKTTTQKKKVKSNIEVQGNPPVPDTTAESDAVVTSSKYVGSVSIKIKDKDGDIRVIKTNHNEGTLNLSKLFAMMMCGYSESLNYVPKFIDLQYSSDSGVTWLTYLKKEIPLTAISHFLDTSLNPSNWVFSCTSVIPFTSLRDPVRADDPYAFRFVLKTDKIMSPVISRELAYFYNITAEELSNIEEGTQAIIEWKMQLVHKNVE